MLFRSLSAEPAELDAWLLRSGYRRPLNGPSSEITATVDHCIGRTDLAALPEMCAKFEISAIVLGSPVPPALMRQIAAGCSEFGCSLHVETNRSHGQKLPARPGAALRAKTLEVPARLHVSAPHVGLTLSVARRCLDIILSVALIAASLPFLLISALAILADSRGSAFFGQVRIGERGQPFRLWKLRTMQRTAEPFARSPAEGDPTVTRIGKLLRGTGFDEIPQLLNILRGDMTFVGPRPEMPFVVEQYTTLQRERLGVRPGLTGLWQLRGSRDAAMHDEIEFDLYYIAFRSTSLDAKLLLETAVFALRGIGRLATPRRKRSGARELTQQHASNDTTRPAPHA